MIKKILSSVDHIFLFHIHNGHCPLLYIYICSFQGMLLTLTHAGY
jgi:hypothetical protein